MKKILFTLMLLVAATATMSAYDFEIDGICYEIDENNEAVVTKNEASPYSGHVTIPPTVTYNGTTYSVTAIGDRAFSNCTNLTSIEIPNSVTSIGYRAFYSCRGLTSIDIPNSVITIGNQVFSWCKGLTNVSIGNSVESISDDAFSSCANLTSIDIPNSVVYIGESAFSWCTGLTSVFIGNSVRSIGDMAFERCRGLTSINIPNSVTEIGNHALDGCSGLTSIDIPNSVITIGDYAFYVCTGLTSVSIGNSVTAIGQRAFNHCTNLTSVVIPASVEWIGDEAFESCSGLTSITVAIGNSNYDSRDNCNAIIETATNELIIGCMNTTIPNSVESIGDRAFSNCTNLTSIEIPNSVTSIGYRAFYDCRGLASIVIPNSVRYICGGAFAYSGLTSIVIPNTVECIDGEVFVGCRLETVKCLGAVPPYISTAERTCCFSDWIHQNATLLVPLGSVEAYLTENCWCLFDHIESWGSARAGDVDSDGRLNITDVTVLIDYLLSGNSAGVSMQGADVDGDGVVNITDVTELIDKLLDNDQPNEPYRTPAPELTVVTDSVAEVVTITATGEGSIIIYEVKSYNYDGYYSDYALTVATGDGEATLEIPFGNWTTEVRVRATAQADEDALLGIGVLKNVRIPAKQVDPGPDDGSHNTGYWLVMVQDNGAKDYVQLQQGANGDYVWFYDVVYPPYFNIGNFYFLINGVPYGAPVDGTEAYVGDAMMNPLFANSSNTYYVYSGYSYTIGIHIVLDEAGEVAGYTVYAAQAGPV